MDQIFGPFTKLTKVLELYDMGMDMKMGLGQIQSLLRPTFTTPVCFLSTDKITTSLVSKSAKCQLHLKRLNWDFDSG